MPTVSQAKNITRRTLSEIVDPGLTPAMENALWKHFESSCAYCGRLLERASRTGHLDHLESDRGNGPRNRVLACAQCNGDEKREQAWRGFLLKKCLDDAERERRISRIEAWVATHPAADADMPPGVSEALRDAERIIDEFHAACTRLREAARARTRPVAQGAAA